MGKKQSKVSKDPWASGKSGGELAGNIPYKDIITPCIVKEIVEAGLYNVELIWDKCPYGCPIHTFKIRLSNTDFPPIDRVKLYISTLLIVGMAYNIVIRGYDTSCLGGNEHVYVADMYLPGAIDLRDKLIETGVARSTIKDYDEWTNNDIHRTNFILDSLPNINSLTADTIYIRSNTMDHFHHTDTDEDQ